MKSRKGRPKWKRKIKKREDDSLLLISQRHILLMTGIQGPTVRTRLMISSTERHSSL